MQILDRYLRLLQVELKGTTNITDTRKAKVARAIGHLSVNKAKQYNDPLLRRMNYFRNLYKRDKSKILRKYSGIIKAKARV